MSKPLKENPKPKAKKSGHKVRLRRYFITGLLVIVPMWGTYLILKTLLVTMEGVLGNFMKSEELYYIPGFGILLLLSLIFFAGLFTTNVFGRKLFNLWEKLLNSVPLVKNVYSMVKSVVDTLSMQTGENENFTCVVLLEYPRRGLFTYGFVTAEMETSIERVSKDQVVSIFVPTVPNPISGFLILVPKADVIPLTLTVEEGMKIVFSVGLHRPELKMDPSRLAKVIKGRSS